MHGNLTCQFLNGHGCTALPSLITRERSTELAALTASDFRVPAWNIVHPQQTTADGSGSLADIIIHWEITTTTCGFLILPYFSGVVCVQVPACRKAMVLLEFLHQPICRHAAGEPLHGGVMITSSTCLEAMAVEIFLTSGDLHQTPLAFLIAQQYL